MDTTAHTLPVGMEMCTVAPGRSVTALQVAGNELREGALVPKLSERIYGPGEPVALSSEDAMHMRAAGFVIDPNDPPHPSRYAAGALPPMQPSVNGKIVSSSYHPS